MPNKDPEKRKAYNRAWYAAHKDEQKTYFRAYYRARQKGNFEDAHEGRGQLMSFEEIGRRLGYPSWSTPVRIYNQAMRKLRKRFTHEQVLEALRDLADQENETANIIHRRVRVAVEDNLASHPVSDWPLFVSPSSRLTEWEKELLRLDTEE